MPRMLMPFIGLLAIGVIGAVASAYYRNRDVYTSNNQEFSQAGVRVAYGPQTISFAGKTYRVDQVREVNLAARANERLGTSRGSATESAVTHSGCMLEFILEGNPEIPDMLAAGVPAEMAQAMAAKQLPDAAREAGRISFSYSMPTAQRGELVRGRFLAALKKAGAPAFQ